MPEIKGVTTSIKASSRVSIKINDTFYTLEYTEERAVPAECDLEVERKALWEAVNNEVDTQVADCYTLYIK